MKKYLFSFFLCVLSLTLSSCDKDEDEIGDVNTVTWEILASDENTTLTMVLSDLPKTIHVSSGYKYTYETESNYARCKLKCEDHLNLLTIKGYVNGKLKETVEGTGYVMATIKIKE